MKRKGLMLLACGLLIGGGLTACGGEQAPVDDGMDYEQNTNTDEVKYVCSIVGSSWANWQPADSAKDENLLLKQDTTNTSMYWIEFDVKTTDEFKLVLDGAWTTQYGMEDIDWESSTQGLLVGQDADYNEGASNRTNIKVTKDCKIRVEYYPYYFITHEPANYLVVTEVAE